MSVERIHAYCPRCGHRQIFRRDSINHLLHLVLTLFSLGLWGVSWLAVVVGKRYRPFYCDQCGFHHHRR